MPRTPLNLVKVTIRLYRGDKERLDSYFPNLGHNAAIRQIVRKALKALDEKCLNDTFGTAVKPAEIDLTELQQKVHLDDD